MSTVALEWPLRASVGFTDCGYYAISAHVDQNTTAGVYSDYNCGSITYDGHKGTDIKTMEILIATARLILYRQTMPSFSILMVPSHCTGT